MLLILLGLLHGASHRHALTDAAALVNTTRFLASICELEWGRIEPGGFNVEPTYRGGSPLGDFERLLERHGAAIEGSGCRDRCAYSCTSDACIPTGDALCEIEAELRFGEDTVAVSAGAFRREGETVTRLHSLRVRGPEPLINRARDLAGCW